VSKKKKDRINLAALQNSENKTIQAEVRQGKPYTTVQNTNQQINR
jgi:hypothetical protein